MDRRVPVTDTFDGGIIVVGHFPVDGKNVPGEGHIDPPLTQACHHTPEITLAADSAGEPEAGGLAEGLALLTFSKTFFTKTGKSHSQLSFRN